MICIQVSASLEWQAVNEICSLKHADIQHDGYVEYFDHPISSFQCRFFKGGSSKTRSAASCQFAIDRWEPSLLIVIGTCGGVDENLKPLDIIMANKTGQYDIIERLGAVKPLFYEDFNVIIDNSWVTNGKDQKSFIEGFIATADQDVCFKEIQMLGEYGVTGSDWESGAISVICKLNDIKFCILRGISDNAKGDNQYLDYLKNLPLVMRKIIDEVLPVVLAQTELPV